MPVRPRPNVISETIDDEVVMIDLSTGIYYSLRGSAAEIWGGVMAGCSREQIRDGLIARYDIGASKATAAVEALFEQLEIDHLIEEVPGDGPDRPEALPVPTELAYAEPVFERYTDMAHVLLMDPIHDVDKGSGWPRGR